MSPDELELSSANVQALYLAASEVRERAYAPYSNFHVGAAVMDETGRIHVGCNVENAAYPIGQCAEASAIAAMVAAGGRQVVAAMVVGEADDTVTPCGGCRQRLREFASDDVPVLLADAKRVREVMSIGDLLPRSFGPDHLKHQHL